MKNGNEQNKTTNQLFTPVSMLPYNNFNFNSLNTLNNPLNINTFTNNNLLGKLNDQNANKKNLNKGFQNFNNFQNTMNMFEPTNIIGNFNDINSLESKLSAMNLGLNTDLNVLNSDSNMKENCFNNQIFNYEKEGSEQDTRDSSKGIEKIGEGERVTRAERGDFEKSERSQTPEIVNTIQEQLLADDM